jgi:hypothetical protein
MVHVVRKEQAKELIYSARNANETARSGAASFLFLLPGYQRLTYR